MERAFFQARAGAKTSTVMRVSVISALAVNFSRQENICPIFKGTKFGCFRSKKVTAKTQNLLTHYAVGPDGLVHPKINAKFSFPHFNLFDGG